VVTVRVSGQHLPPPVKTTLVDTLVERGYDVWLENWRASIDLPPNRWTLDQSRRYDHPWRQDGAAGDRATEIRR